MFVAAMEHNLRQIRRAIADIEIPSPRILDLGCWDGTTTARYTPDSAVVFGIDGNRDAARSAAACGIHAICGDLNTALPFRADSFDIVTSNQVLEHLHNTDLFFEEAHRLLTKGGVVIASTENLASWHNVAALIAGWQAFSLTNVTVKRGGLGNPLANFRGEEAFGTGWQHVRIFSFRGLKELAEAHGFHDVTVLGAGYYPLPTAVADVDPRHAALLTVVGRKA